MSIPNLSTIIHYGSSAAAGMYALSRFQIAVHALTLAGRTINPTFAAVPLLVGIKKTAEYITPYLVKGVDKTVGKEGLNDCTKRENLAINLASHSIASYAGLVLAGKLGLISTVSLPMIPTAIVGGAVLLGAPAVFNYVAKLFVDNK